MVAKKVSAAMGPKTSNVTLFKVRHKKMELYETKASLLLSNKTWSPKRTIVIQIAQLEIIKNHFR